MKIVLHDYFESAEGGGRLSLTLARLLEADLAYGYKKKDHPFFARSDFFGREFTISSASVIPVWKQYTIAKAFAQRTGFLQGYNLAIYSGFYAPLAILNYGATRNIYYCHTPPRFMYDQREFYFKQIPRICHPVLKSFIRYLQPRYEKAVAKMDVVVTNSVNVQKRIKHYLDVDSIVVHPPCDTKRFKWLGQGDYYLSMARLDPLKRVDLIVRAFVQMPDKKLVVCSGGSEFATLRKIAAGADNIVFSGWCSDNELTDLVGNAIATIYIPQDEDFGMSPVESMAAGKPVIGVAEGGLLETIKPFETGLLLPAELGVELLCDAVNKMTRSYALAMRESCERQALLFREDVFSREMRSVEGQL